jgi:hypothetical protein
MAESFASLLRLRTPSLAITPSKRPRCAATPARQRGVGGGREHERAAALAFAGQERDDVGIVGKQVDAHGTTLG